MPTLLHDRRIPALRPGLSLLPFDSASQNHKYLLTNNEGRRWMVSPPLSEILQRIDGILTTEAIADTLDPSGRAHRRIHDIIWFELASMNLLQGIDMQESGKPELALAFKITLIPEDVLVLPATIFQYLFADAVFYPFCVAAGALEVWWYLHHTLRQVNVFAFSDWYVSLIFLVISCFLHEFGHASCARRFNIRSGAIGFGVYWIFPVLYTDVSRAWSLSRKERMRIDVAGIYFQLLFSCLLMLPVGGLRHAREMAVLWNTLSYIPNLNPFLRTDGYWLLSDALGIPKLHKILGDLLIPSRYRTLEYSAPVRIALRVYCFLAVGFAALLAVEIYRLFSEAAVHSLPQLLHVISARLQEGFLQEELWAYIVRLLFLLLMLALIVWTLFRFLRKMLRWGFMAAAKSSDSEKLVL